MPRRLVILGGGIIGCEFASIFNRFGTEVTIIEMLPSLIPSEDEDAAKELQKAFKKRDIALHLSKQCTQVDDHGDHLTVHFGEGETVDCDLMLVAVGRGALVDGIGLEEAGVTFDRGGSGRTTTGATNVPHIYAAGDVAGYWQLAHTGFREGEVAAENAMGHDATVGEPAVPRRSTPTPRSPGSASPRRRRASPRGQRRRGPLPVGRDRAGRHVREHDGLGEDDPRVDVRRASASSSSARTRPT